MESAGGKLVKGDLRAIARASVEPRDDAEHPAEPLLRLHLQCTGRAYCRRNPLSVRRGALEPHDRERRHDVQFRVGDRERAAVAENSVVNSS